MELSTGRGIFGCRRRCKGTELRVVPSFHLHPVSFGVNISCDVATVQRVSALSPAGEKVVAYPADVDAVAGGGGRFVWLGTNHRVVRLPDLVSS